MLQHEHVVDIVKEDMGLVVAIRLDAFVRKLDIEEWYGLEHVTIDSTETRITTLRSRGVLR